MDFLKNWQTTLCGILAGTFTIASQNDKLVHASAKEAFFIMGQALFIALIGYWAPSIKPGNKKDF